MSNYSIRDFGKRIYRMFSGYFSQLLLFLVLLFASRPYDRTALYVAVWEFFFTLLFLSAIFNCDHSKPVKICAISFAIPSLLGKWFNLLYPSTVITLIYLVFTILFIIVITTSIVKSVVINARVKMETLRGVICAYFMVAFGFSFLYLFIDTLSPNSFYFSSAHFDPTNHIRYLSEMMYFSFVTLLCIGYGDITAIKDVAKTFVILEGIIGQFYIAILVARLVAVYSFYEHKLHLASQEKNGEKAPPKSRT